jgi:D-sedoheptulose 7-phosphate isomerase
MTTNTEVMGKYVSGLREALQSLSPDSIDAVVQVLRRARQRRNQVFIVGNGGSAATAAHMAADLGKMTIVEGLPRHRVIALADSIPTLTAWANDFGYDQVFAQQLRSLASAGDVLVAISTSGASPNVLHAAETAREMGLVTVGLTGREGGELRDLVDHCVIVEGRTVGQIEDVHHAIGHILTEALIQNEKS